jgi:outer membrane protein TolC
MSLMSCQCSYQSPLLLKGFFVALVWFSTPWAMANSTLGPLELIKIVQNLYRIGELKQWTATQTQFSEKTSSILKNPEIQYGRGRLEYNAGQGVADYEEYSIVQPLVINGTPRLQERMAQIKGQKSQAILLQSSLSLQARALSLAFEWGQLKKKMSHVGERKKHLQMVSNYLTSRKFNSPQKQVERQLIQNKIDEINLENSKVFSKEQLIKSQLEVLLGNITTLDLQIPFPGPDKIKAILNKLKDKPSLREAILKNDHKISVLERERLRKQWIPELQFYYMHNEERFFGGNKNDIVGLGIELPVFDWGRNKTGAASAQVFINELRIQKSKAFETMIQRDLFYKAQTALSYLDVYPQQSIEFREARFIKASKSFAKGQLDAQTFLELEHQVHALRSDLLRSQGEALDNTMQLIALTGQDHLLMEVFQ